MQLIIIIIIAIIVIHFIRKHRANIKENHELLIFGETGAGKTLYGVKLAIKHHKHNLKVIKIKNLIIKIKNKLLKQNQELEETPKLYANFPINYRYFEFIKKEHLLLKERQTKNNITILDELGSMASQYEFDDPSLRVNIAEYTSKFRHYYGNDAMLILTDQSSERILKEIKYSLGNIYELQNFKKFLFIGQFDVIEYKNFKQIDTFINEEQIRKKRIIIPRKRLYESRYLQHRIDYLQLGTNNKQINEDLTTNEIIRLGTEKSNLDKTIKKYDTNNNH